jgi:hypothetical protein
MKSASCLPLTVNGPCCGLARSRTPTKWYGRMRKTTCCETPRELLGQEALLQLLSGHFQSTDPDLRARKDPGYTESLQALQTFILKHSPQLLAEKDRDFLLQEKFVHFVWYSIGAAKLDRKTQATFCTRLMSVSTGSGTTTIGPF